MKKGSSVRLECKASGNPVPKITWSRKNNLLPGGEQTMVTQTLVLDKVDRHQAGIYQCMASNGVGEDVSSQIVLHVLCKYSSFITLCSIRLRKGRFDLVLYVVFVDDGRGESSATPTK